MRMLRAFYKGGVFSPHSLAHVARDRTKTTATIWQSTRALLHFERRLTHGASDDIDFAAQALPP